MNAGSITRRGALSALAAIAAAPAIAPAADDKANAIWKDRQASAERLAALVEQWNAADETLPDWVRSGRSRIDQDGNPCGEFSAWPLDTSITPPPRGERITRPTIEDCRQMFDMITRGLWD